MKRFLLFLLVFWSSFLSAQDIILSNKDTMRLKSTVTKIPLYKSSWIRISGYLDVNTTSYEIKKFNPEGPPPPPVNLPPTANAGNNQTIALPVNSVTLDASGSTDQDGSIVSYQWVKNSGPGGNIITPLGKQTAVENLTVGAYTYRVTVTDNSGAQSSAVVNITVNSPPVGNQRPIARAGSDIAIILPINTVTLDASGSSDADGTIVNYLWKKVSGTGSTIQSSNAKKTDVTSLTVGTYKYTIDVTDNTGAIATDEVQVIVNPALPPDPGPGTGASFTVPQIPFSNPDLNAPGRGVEDWHNQNRVNIPTEGTNTQRLDAYFRSQLTWCQLEKSQGVYDLTPLTKLLNSCIDKRQKMSFGIMTVYHDNEPVVTSYDGFRSSYPEYLHRLMQQESTKDWHNSDGWIPNYNSSHYLSRLKALHVAVNNVLETGSYNGVRYKDIIYVIDVRGYGNYGEWHNGGLVDLVSDIPSGAHATTATLKAIIDAHTSVFQNFQLSIIMTAFDANWLQHTRTSAEVAYYALTTKNAYGPLGWRRDNWGATDNYIRDLLVNNTRTYNGVALNSLIMKVWEKAPITGEPMNTAPNEYGDFENQVRLYHATSFGNGNINQTVSTGVKNNVRAASKASGYRLSVTAGSITTGSNGKISVTWSNSGIAPTYENWDVVYELKSGTTVVWTGTSTFKLRLFLPGTTTHTDNFSNIPTGSNTLSVKVVDPVGYREPLPLAIVGRKTDGSYSLNQPKALNFKKKVKRKK